MKTLVRKLLFIAFPLMIICKPLVRETGVSPALKWVRKNIRSFMTLLKYDGYWKATNRENKMFVFITKDHKTIGTKTVNWSIALSVREQVAVCIGNFI